MLMEPFQGPHKIDHYRTRLRFTNAVANSSSKIWIFWKEDWSSQIILDTIQQITMKFIKDNKGFIITTIYVRCNALKRLELWEKLEYIADNNQVPWIVEVISMFDLQLMRNGEDWLSLRMKLRILPVVSIVVRWMMLITMAADILGGMEELRRNVFLKELIEYWWIKLFLIFSLLLKYII